MLFVFVRMESYYVRNLPIGKCFQALTFNPDSKRQLLQPDTRKRTSFRIPELHLAVVTTAEELPAIVRESQILHRFRVAHEGTQTVPVLIHIPQLY